MAYSEGMRVLGYMLEMRVQGSGGDLMFALPQCKVCGHQLIKWKCKYGHKVKKYQQLSKRLQTAAETEMDL
jgi:hypothetical protein